MDSQVCTLVPCIAPFSFGAFFGNGYKTDEIVSHDARLLNLTEFDMKKVRLETALRPGESSVSGCESLYRLNRQGLLLLGGNVMQAIWEHDLIPHSWIMSTKLGSTILQRLLGIGGKGKTTVCFGGVVYRNSHGEHAVASFLSGTPAPKVLKDQFARNCMFAVYDY